MLGCVDPALSRQRFCANLECQGACLQTSNVLLSPLQDLLALLHEQGPFMEGIFWLGASEHASHEIREALDSGTEVQLASQPVHVLTVILKDFLHKIPSKFLVAELYQEWMAALQKSSRKERLVGLKEVARKLPEANLLLLLKTSLRLLQNISSNVTISKMSASNLVICMRPNLLGPPEEDTLPLDILVQVTAKVRCVSQPAAAFQAHTSFALQRFLAASSFQPTLSGELQGSAATQLQLSVRKAG
ncbi:hypothetical protein AV530_012885 [Patagioenas fasciata monilis]|uniref:Rho-GAP domain-containing protein n=1 Tax=Patagioenas fasciata monilis TaxID=372326 RepID=A0A1V4J9C3_PATFA|nr:hypothetical protein AV530_012885 [Patagioenas fasciata monilis]